MTDSGQNRDCINNPLVFNESCATLVELLRDDALPRVTGLEKIGRQAARVSHGDLLGDRNR
jgi:hypothetical protein